MSEWIVESGDLGRFPEDPAVLRHYEERAKRLWGDRIEELRRQWGEPVGVPSVSQTPSRKETEDVRPTHRWSLTLACASLLAILLLGFGLPAAAQEEEEDLRVLRRQGDGGLMMGYTDAANALYHHVQDEVIRHLDEREKAIASIDTPAEWRKRRERVRETLLDVLGPFPERTPLNVRITGVSERDGYRLETLIFDSRPGYPVTAALFVPERLAVPAPAVLYLSGHSATAFRYDPYQNVILNMVAKGFVVLAIDPVGQGERLEYTDEEVGRLGGHAVPGAQLFLTSGSLAREMIWDGIRAVDYLVTRPEVDPNRIGATGRSGGGTQTAYLAAVDERIAAAAPENYITSLRRLWQTRGPQDPEQHFVNGIARGLDHADLLVARAPKPTLLIATTRDIFSIQGTRETYRAAKRAFAALGAPEKLRMVEDDAPHASTLANREATYAFFQQALGLAGDAHEEEVELLSDEALRITETGQVGSSLGPETSFSLNRRAGEELRAARQSAAQANPDYPASAVRAARDLAGYHDPGQPGEMLFMGRYRRGGYSIEKYIVPGEGGYPIPLLLMLPAGSGPHAGVLYLHPEGKAADIAPGGRMERLVRQGFAVVAPELPGTGEMAPGDYRGGSEDPRTPVFLWFGAVGVEASIVGTHAADIVRVARAIQRHPGVAAGELRAVGIGPMGSALLHAAAFDPVITGVALVEPLVSYHELVSTRVYDPRFVPGGVARMLTAYDLPTLAASLAPRPLLVVNPVDATADLLGNARASAAYQVVRREYDDAGRSGSFIVRQVARRPAVGEVLAEWLEATSP